ncbi:MAG: ribonuclease J [Deltaproteobacteria bacterium]|jgi:ribonuclease J|nr:ribonuclease J [Deltaproteobacteria bacterium]
MPVRSQKAEGAATPGPGKAPRKSSFVELIPLGGLGEIGLNCMAIAHKGDILVIDAGLMFPRPDQHGVDIVVPDFDFLKENRDSIVGVVLTHGHEDHIGALSFLAKECPGLNVYGTQLTLALATHRLMEHNMVGQVVQHAVKAGDSVSLGAFDLEFVQVSHSILDSVAVAVTTAAGTIIHTGDFKMDPSAPEGERLDLLRLAEYGEQGVLALLSDSTNSDVPGYSRSEREVGEALQEIFKRSKGRIILACFASSIARIREVAQAASLSGRRLILDGRSMVANARLAVRLGYLEIPSELSASTQQANILPPEKVCVVLTGSQGEPLSALSRLAAGEHRSFRVFPGDTVIFSARAIPGNETAISSLVNQFLALGADVIDPSTNMVHASGHGHQEELKLMLSLTKPRYLVPVHGELHHLWSHAKLGWGHGLPKARTPVLKNGSRLAIHKDGSFTLKTPVKAGRMLVDGDRLGKASDPVMRDRRRLAEQGVVSISVALDPSCGALLSSPKAILHGVQYEDEADLQKTLADGLTKAITQTLLPSPMDDEKTFLLALEELVRRETRHIVRNHTGRKPVILSQIMSLHGLAPKAFQAERPQKGAGPEKAQQAAQTAKAPKTPQAEKTRKTLGKTPQKAAQAKAPQAKASSAKGKKGTRADGKGD